MIEDGLEFAHNVAHAELIGSPQLRLEQHRKIKYSVPSPLDRVSKPRTVRRFDAFRHESTLSCACARRRCWLHEETQANIQARECGIERLGERSEAIAERRGECVAVQSFGLSITGFAWVGGERCWCGAVGGGGDL